MAELSPFRQLILALFTDQCRASYNELINLPAFGRFMRLFLVRFRGSKRSGDTSRFGHELLGFLGLLLPGRQGFSNGLAGIHLDDNGLVADVLLQENHDKVGHQAEMSDSIKLPTTGHRGSDGPVAPFSKWGTIQDLSSFGLRYGVDRILFAKSGQRGSTSAASALNLQAAPMLNLTANIIKGGEMVNRRSVLKIGAVRKLCSTWPF